MSVCCHFSYIHIFVEESSTTCCHKVHKCLMQRERKGNITLGVCKSERKKERIKNIYIERKREIGRGVHAWIFVVVEEKRDIEQERERSG